MRAHHRRARLRAQRAVRVLVGTGAAARRVARLYASSRGGSSATLPTSSADRDTRELRCERLDRSIHEARFIEFAQEFRGRGYATAILSRTLREARHIGIRSVLLTVADTNLASIRVIEKNRGVFERVTISPRSGDTMHRYWIDTTQGAPH